MFHHRFSRQLLTSIISLLLTLFSLHFHFPLIFPPSPLRLQKHALNVPLRPPPLSPPNPALPLNLPPLLPQSIHLPAHSRGSSRQHAQPANHFQSHSRGNHFIGSFTQRPKCRLECVVAGIVAYVVAVSHGEEKHGGEFEPSGGSGLVDGNRQGLEESARREGKIGGSLDVGGWIGDVDEDSAEEGEC